MYKKITLEAFLLQRLTPQTVKNYQHTIGNFLKMHPRAKRYKYNNLVSYLAEQAKKYPNVQTRMRMLAAIKKYYEYLVYTEQRQDHPCQTLNIKKGGTPSIQLQDLFTSDELSALLNRENRYKHLDIRNKIILSLMIYQGLTSDELIRLDVDNVDLDNGTIYIKGSSKLNRRTLELKINQMQLFINYINNTRLMMIRCKSDKLILNKLGKPISVDGINSMIEPLATLYPDRPLNPRSIRMSVISNWLNENKLSLERAQELAGHKWPSTTEKYIRIDNLKQRELINKYFPI